MEKGRFIYLVLLIFIVSQVYSQNNQYSVNSKKAIKQYEEALLYYDQFQNDRAVTTLNELLASEPEFIEAYLVLADIYKQQNKTILEIEAYKKITEINPSFFVYTYYNLANAQFYIGKYKEAIESITLFLNQGVVNPDLIKKAEYFLKVFNHADSLFQQPVPFNPVNLGNNINSEYDEYWPSISADDSVFVTTVLLPISINGRIKFQEDLYVSYKNNGAWTRSVPVGPPLNTTGNEGAQTISIDGLSFFYTACNRRNGFGKCDLHFVTREDGVWQNPILMQPPVNTRYSEKQPCISSNGKELFFSSNRPGGKGKMDIWVTELNDEGYWKEPENLGDSINTFEDEISPFIHFDNTTLYFSSKGHFGLGSYDIFMSKRENETWTAPKNLGYPINTYGDELGLIVNAKGNTAYYSSSRNTEKGKDIFEFQLYDEIRPTSVTYVKGNVYDKNTYKKLSATIDLMDLEFNGYSVKTRSRKNGSFIIALPSMKTYAFNVYKKGYLFYSEHFNLKHHSDSLHPFVLDIPLEPIIKGSSTILRNIFFESDSYELLSISISELERLNEFLVQNPTVHIELGGHTDNTGTKDHNLQLSENRAKAVYTYLINKEISSDRLSYKGYGESKPIETNETEKGKAQNRRTEFTIIAK